MTMADVCRAPYELGTSMWLTRIILFYCHTGNISFNSASWG